jgi:hypothetical protein
LTLGRAQRAVVGADPRFVSLKYLEMLGKRYGLRLHQRLEDVLADAVRLLAELRCRGTKSSE